MTEWKIERIIHFDFAKGEFCKNGFAHFGFHDRNGNQYVLAHQKHFLGLIGKNGKVEWTVSGSQVFDDTPNIAAQIQFPIYIDSLLDGTLVSSNFKDSRFYRIDPIRMQASLFIEGTSLGMKRAGNCVVDDEGCVWLNEVDGCRVWRFDPSGKPLLALGDGKPGFQPDIADFDAVRFSWIYDIRRGPDGNIYVLDSRNFAVRMIDLRLNRVCTLAGTGKPGYDGDGGDPRFATFGGSPSARFDGPIALSLDEEGNIFVGDKFNRVVRMIERRSNLISTIAGDSTSKSEEANRPDERDPMALRLPKIGSMDFFGGRLFVPTDLTDNAGDLVVLRKCP